MAPRAALGAEGLGLRAEQDPVRPHLGPQPSLQAWPRNTGLLSVTRKRMASSARTCPQESGHIVLLHLHASWSPRGALQHSHSGVLAWKSHGQRSLAGYVPKSQLDTTE